eukprot:403354618
METINQLQVILSTVDQLAASQLVAALKESIVNSNKILEIEASIKQLIAQNQYQQRIFLTLCSVYLAYEEDPQIQWLASIILKNTLKDNISNLKQHSNEELDLIKKALLSKLIIEGENLFAGNKKLQEEYYFIFSTIVVKEFYNNSEDTVLLRELIVLYQNQFNHHILNTLTQIFETGDDDRFCNFVPQIMPQTLVYLQSIRNSKLLFLVWQMLQNTQWSVGTDQETLEKCLNLDILRQIMGQLLNNNFISVNSQGQQLIDMEVLQEKRYSAKILTLLFREFMTTKKLKPEAQKFNTTVYLLSLKNLMYLLPHYLTSYTFNQSFEELDDEYISEFQALIVQILSLMSTIISHHPKTVLRQFKQVNEVLLTVMFQYCIEGVQYERTYSQDPNIFLIDFLESGEDYETMISIRSTVIDFIEEAQKHYDFDRSTLEKVVALFVQDSFSVTPEMSNLAFQKIKQAQSIDQLSELDDLFILPGYSIMKYEVAFFMIGQLQDSLTIPAQLIDQCIKLLSSPETQVLLKLRSLWLLEKLVSAPVVRKQKETIGRQIFQIISDMFVNQSEFVLNYQCIKTLHRYIKLIDIKKSYPESYKDMLCIFMQKISQTIPQCKDETIHVPIESLSFLSKIDQEACCKVVDQVMPSVMELYSKYYQDGIIGPDIVDLIKLWARFPDNQAFAQLFLPQVNIIIQQYYNYTCQQSNPIEAQKMIDSSILKNMLSILTSYILQTKYRQLNQESIDIIKYLFRMELEILNVSKEIYICIYTILSLSSFIQAVPSLGKEYSVQIQTVLKKILTFPGGLDESSLLYVGHFILILTQNGDLESEFQQQILLLIVKRLAKSQVPSTTKSFLIPIATSIIQYGDQSINFLLQNSDISDIKSMIQNWISYCSHFQDKFSKEISKRGLICLLHYSLKNIEFAGLKIHLNEFSKQEILLQTKLVQVLGRDLIYSVEFNQKKKNQNHGGDDQFSEEEYGDDSLSDGDEVSVDEDDAGGPKKSKKRKHSEGDDDDDFEDIEDGFDVDGSFGQDGVHAAENQDEEHLLTPYLERFTDGQQDVKQLAKLTLKSIGRETLYKIVNTVTDDGDSLFSTAEQEALLQL